MYSGKEKAPILPALYLSIHKVTIAYTLCNPITISFHKCKLYRALGNISTVKPVYSPVHMRWFTHGVYIIHICIICTRVYFWACERNCIYVKVNLHMCKYTPRVNIHLLRPGVYLHLHVCILYIYVFLVMWTRSKYTHVCKCNFSSYFKRNWQ